MVRVSVLDQAARIKAGKTRSYIVTGDAELTPELITAEAWCPTLFKEPRRALAHFLEAWVIGIDVDEKLPLEAALASLANTRHVVGTTTHHQLPKGDKPACDRYRVVLFLEEPIFTPEDYKATLRALAGSLGLPADGQAMDAARWFIPCREVVSVNLDGHLSPVTLATSVSQLTASQLPVTSPTTTGQKGKLARATRDFLAQEPDTQGGGWHLSFIKACMDFKEQGYSEQEAANRLRSASPIGELDETDLQQLADVYANRGGALLFRPAWPHLNKEGVPVSSSVANQRYLISEVLGFTFFANKRREVIYVSHRDEPGKRQLLTDSFFAKLNVSAREQGIQAGEPLRDLVVTLAEENAFDPILDAFNELTWDGEKHIDKLFDTIELPANTDAESRKWYALFLRRWIIGVLTKVYSPGSENNVLVFQGQQAAGKSRWLKRLAQLWPEGFGEGHVSPDDKDHELRHLDNFLWHVAEFDSTTSRREVGALKDYFTKDTINARRPYGRLPITGRSICSFCASVNSYDFLHDATGNRRYLVIPVVSINADHSVSIPQVFAEAKAAMLAGEQQWFSRTEIEQINRLNSKFVSKEEYLEILESAVEPGEDAMTISQLMEEIGFGDIQVTRPIRSNIRTTLEKRGVTSKVARSSTHFHINRSRLKEFNKPVGLMNLKVIRASDS